MDYGILFLPAALFPAIPLMMINYANRYSSLSVLIRKIHDDLIENSHSKGDLYIKRYLEQIQTHCVKDKNIPRILDYPEKELSPIIKTTAL